MSNATFECPRCGVVQESTDGRCVSCAKHPAGTTFVGRFAAYRGKMYVNPSLCEACGRYTVELLTKVSPNSLRKDFGYIPKHLWMFEERSGWICQRCLHVDTFYINHQKPTLTGIAKDEEADLRKRRGGHPDLEGKIEPSMPHTGHMPKVFTHRECPDRKLIAREEVDVNLKIAEMKRLIQLRNQVGRKQRLRINKEIMNLNHQISILLANPKAAKDLKRVLSEPFSYDPWKEAVDVGPRSLPNPKAEYNVNFFICQVCKKHRTGGLYPMEKPPGWRSKPGEYQKQKLVEGCAICAGKEISC